MKQELSAIIIYFLLYKNTLNLEAFKFNFTSFI